MKKLWEKIKNIWAKIVEFADEYAMGVMAIAQVIMYIFIGIAVVVAALTGKKNQTTDD